MELLNCGEVQHCQARAIISRLSSQIGERELAVVRDELGWKPDCCRVESVDSAGPGNVLLLELEAEHVMAIFTGFGERGTSAEQVARRAVASERGWLSADVPLDEHLADQLLIPMALAGAGVFRTLKPSLHSMTNATIIELFLRVKIQFEAEGDTAWKVSVNRRKSD